MGNYSSNNKRIAKNTLLLYVRMLFLLLINLYTSRVILNALGVTDFGIYNAVGGVVGMFAIISGSLSASISRFITFDLGLGDKDQLKKTFSSSVMVQLVLCVIVLIIAESVGVWFLNNKMVIPENRSFAANWVLQFSLITFIINLISVPYNAAVIAHEKMSAFAYISVVEGFGKLLIAFSITFSPLDRLIGYAAMMALLAVTIRILYGFYCNKHFEECQFHFCWDRNHLKRMFGFAGWNFIGAASSILRDQGGNIVINLFYGPAVNAARAISMQVYAAVNGFVYNFMTAVNPQITKSYASKNNEYMMELILQGAKFSFYLMLILSLPILFNTHYILTLWLKLLPEHSILFVQLVLIMGLSETLSIPLITAMLATGDIRNYQLIVGGLQLLNLPISYVLLRIDFIPETVIIVAIILSQICLFARLVLLKRMIYLPVRKYLTQVYLRIILVSLLASSIPFFLKNFISDSFVSFAYSTIICLLSSLATVYFIGLSKRDQVYVKKVIASRIQKR